MTGPRPAEVVVTAGPEPPAGWRGLLGRARGADFFHEPLWTEVVCRHLPGRRPLWLAAHRDGTLVGGLPAVRRRRGPLASLLSHHDGTPAGPLLADDLAAGERREVLRALLSAYAREGTRGGLGASFVLHPELEAELGPTAREAGWTARPVPTAIMPLRGGIEHVDRHVLRLNRRNERNRSLKRGCRSEVTRDPGLLARYHAIYAEAARRWRVRPTPLALLEELLRRGEGRAFLVVVSCGDRVLGGHVCLEGARRVTAWNGATVRDRPELFPATLLIWADLVEACRRGADWLDLGGSGGIASLENFKRLLGAREQARCSYERPTVPARLLGALRRAARRAAAGPTRPTGGRRERAPAAGSRPEAAPKERT